MNWRWTKPLESEGLISEFETKENYDLPKDYIEIIKNFNAGYPEFEEFCYKQGDRIISRFFNNLLSFNKDDRTNIWLTNTDVISQNIKGILIIYFGWMLGISVFTALIQERKNAVYKCTKCGTSFQPSVIGFMLSPNKMNDRWLRCPKCHKRVRYGVPDIFKEVFYCFCGRYSVVMVQNIGEKV